MHRCNLGVALEQETILGFSGPRPKRLLAPSLIQRIAKGAGGKGPRQKRQKSSKSVKKFFDTFRQFSRRAKNVKNRQKVSKTFSTLFDNFRASPFFRPLLQSADLSIFGEIQKFGPCTRQSGSQSLEGLKIDRFWGGRRFQGAFQGLTLKLGGCSGCLMFFFCSQAVGREEESEALESRFLSENTTLKRGGGALSE